MKSLILALSMAVLCAGLAPTDADARRIGGGGSSGMQRSVPARTPPAAAPAQTAQPAQAAAAVPATAAAAAAAPKRSWMGPIAGLAAGLGIAALMSHFGMGAELGNIVTMVLFALLARGATATDAAGVCIGRGQACAQHSHRQGQDQ